jgi:hypothetical protein
VAAVGNFRLRGECRLANPWLCRDGLHGYFGQAFGVAHNPGGIAAMTVFDEGIGDYDLYMPHTILPELGTD